MENLKNSLKQNKLFLYGFIIIFIIIVISNIFIFFYFKYKLDTKPLDNDNLNVESDDLDDNSVVKVSVEIKGEVNSPGVYEVLSDKRVNDVILLADGLTDNADTSVNNLSKKVKDEMIIIIYSKEEVLNFTKQKEIEDLQRQECVNKCLSNNNSCFTKEDIEANIKDYIEKQNNSNDNNDNNDNKKISINTATKEELLTLPDIGNSKANAIIEYRKKSKFKSIEDIKKVSGIGDKLYDKIKDFITT